MARLMPIEAMAGRRTNDTGDATSWAKVLADIPLFAGLGRRSLRQVAGTGRIVRFHNATAVVRSGEPGDAFYVVIDGEVSVRRRGLPALSLDMGSYFGEM